MSHSTPLSSLALGLVALLTASPAVATELFSVDFSGAATLYRMDQVGGSANVVGPVGNDNIGDLTSDTRAGSATLWGVRIASDELLTIDPVTGAQVDSVPLTLDTNGAFQGDPGHMTSIAFDPVSGLLYGNTTVGFGAPFDALYSIDPVTGQSEFIGRITFENVFSLGFSQDGTLYGISDTTDQLISINLLNGNGTFIADLQVGFAFDIASRPEDDEMFLVDSGTFSLYTMDVSNGNLTGVGGYGGSPNLVGLAFSQVPEPGTLLLVGLGLTFFARRRR